MLNNSIKIKNLILNYKKFKIRINKLNHKLNNEKIWLVMELADGAFFFISSQI